MRLLLNKTRLDFDIEENVMEEVLHTCGWDTMDVWELLEGDLDRRSDPDFLRIIEEAGGKAFKRTGASHQHYQIVELDIPEDEKDDYFIDDVNGFERILKVVKPNTIKRIHGEIEWRGEDQGRDSHEQTNL